MDWKKTLATFAPTIATALGGPLAGMAAKVIANKLGIDPADIEQAVLTGDPEVMLKLKQAEQSFLLEMEKLGVERDKLIIGDVQDARGLAKLDMTPHMILSTIYTIGYFGLIASLIFDLASVPDGNSGHLMSGLIGVLTTLQVKVADFWFGSSHGSKQKTHEAANKG